MSNNNPESEELNNLSDTEWWQAGAEDDFSFEKKLLRTGCRPLKRDYIKCIHQNSLNYTLENCMDLKRKLVECENLLKYAKMGDS